MDKAVFYAGDIKYFKKIPYIDEHRFFSMLVYKYKKQEGII